MLLFYQAASRGQQRTNICEQNSWFYILKIHLAAVSLDPVLEKHPEYCTYNTKLCKENRCEQVTPAEDDLFLRQNSFHKTSYSLFELLKDYLIATNAFFSLQSW